MWIFEGEEVGSPVAKLEKDRIGGTSIAPIRLLIEDTHGGRGLRVRTLPEEPEAAKPTFEGDCQKILDHLVRAPQGVAGVELLAEKVGLGEKRTGSLVSSLEASGGVVRLRVHGVRGNAQRIFHPDYAPTDAPF